MCDSDSGESTSSISSLAPSTSSTSSSGLSEFVDAKTELQEIYQDLGNYIRNMQVTVVGGGLETEEQLQGHLDKVRAIEKVLARDRMKVAFFGRTSNGKSAVINAMLHERILPSAMGHTTSCFCQVQASDDTGHVRIEKEDQQLELSSLNDLASAHSPRALKPKTLLHVNMPRSRCSLLDYDVVLMDTPGVDVTAQLDDCLDRYCLDADVFILVLNAESTVSRVERQFFKEVASRLSRPNLFILNNRWDVASSQEPDMEEQVKDQHVERCLQLLVEDLGVYTDEELARKRIYHVSALEALQLRMGMKTAPSPQTQERYREFQRFETDFSTCLAHSALRTKFEQHLLSAQEILRDIEVTLTKPLSEKVQQEMMQCVEERRMLRGERDQREIQISYRREQLGFRVDELCDESLELGQRVLREQINLTLAAGVKAFSQPFHPQLPRLLTHYQRCLSAHLDALLTTKIVEQISLPLQQKMYDLEQEVQGEASLEETLTWQLVYSLDCQSLMKDFQPDLRFRFSWGLAALCQRLQSQLPMPSNSAPDRKPLNGHKDVQPTVTPLVHKSQLEMALAFLKSDTSVGTIVLGGLAVRSLGWRTVLVLGGLLGTIYLYELLSWTPAAQERSFKRQYSRHLQQHLRAGVLQTASGFELQIRQQLAKIQNRWAVEAAESRAEVDAREWELSQQMETLEELQLKLKELRGRGHVLALRLREFQELYLQNRN
ncbi:transmembrane GTPase fzo [Drosophila bipectinata]|uniref:transmembrane GTPase fzo n=1 Tax=Drosophila bipectinata TaxID=42026 RepID=UPI001C89CF27|nr:transmembrane GTPase fzo [Drosophila bipectinata]